MKIARLIPFIILPFLFCCVPKKPEVPMAEVPAGRLVQGIERRSSAFSTLRGLAAVQISVKGRKRSFDSVGIVVKDQDRFRIEAYNLLGQVIMTVLWNGKEILFDLEGERRILEPGSRALERVIGADVEPAELSALLSGNIPAIGTGSQAKLLCPLQGSCVLKVQKGDREVRVYAPDPAPPSGEPPVRSYEVYRRGEPLYRVKFESFEQISGYSLPMKIQVENPENRMSMTVEYAEADVNVPLAEEPFMISTEGR